MKSIRQNRLYYIACVLLAACNNFASAQNGIFTARASSAKVGVKDQVEVTFTLKDLPNLQNFFPPATWTNDFNILAGPMSYKSTNINIVNGRAVQSETYQYTYLLQAKHEGTFTIPAAIAKDAAGNAFQSNTINMQVVPGSLAAQQPRQQQSNPYDAADPYAQGQDPYSAMMRQRSERLKQQLQQQRHKPGDPSEDNQMQVDEKQLNKDIFIKVSVDKSKVHVGEQITASYKLYARIPMQAAISKLPSLNGFWTQDFEIPKMPKPAIENVEGKQYQVFLLKKSALFPQQAGILELDPAEAQGTARVMQQIRQRNPFADMFDDPAFSLFMNDPVFNGSMFSTVAYRDIPVHLKSTPVKITVTALPEKTKPADYTGAVGNFSIASKVSKKEISTDDAITYTITITGSGNLKLIETPTLKLPNGLDVYDPQVVDTVTGRSTTISGAKIITYPLTPHTPGDYEIPAVPFSYYNPATGEYVSLSTEPVKIHVTPGKHYNPNIATNNNNVSLKDIHNITVQPIKEMVFKNKPLLFTPIYWSMYALPLFTFIFFAFWKKREDDLSKDVVLLRNKRANKVALKRLMTAKTLLQEGNKKLFYEEISKAIWLYLSDKLNIPLSSLSRESAQIAFERYNVPGALHQQLENVITDCETALYASSAGSSQMQQTYQDAIDIISKLEGIF